MKPMVPIGVPTVTNYAHPTLPIQDIVYEQEQPWGRGYPPYEVNKGYFTPKHKGHRDNTTRGRGRGNYHQSPFRGGPIQNTSCNSEAPWRMGPNRGRGDQQVRGGPVSTSNRFAPLQDN